jgi:short-subunit dehydrogenase involved in D-alanine esterification of teichoic acids
LQALFLNAGVQHVMDVSKPHTVEISKLSEEININYLGVVNIFNAFLPFFQKKPASEKSAVIV